MLWWNLTCFSEWRKVIKLKKYLFKIGKSFNRPQGNVLTIIFVILCSPEKKSLWVNMFFVWIPLDLLISVDDDLFCIYWKSCGSHRQCRILFKNASSLGNWYTHQARNCCLWWKINGITLQPIYCSAFFFSSWVCKYTAIWIEGKHLLGWKWFITSIRVFTFRLSTLFIPFTIVWKFATCFSPQLLNVTNTLND